MLVSHEFDDEVILANFETGVYYSLAETGADVWIGLKSGATADEIVVKLATFYATGADDIKPSVESFIGQLLTEKIILPRSDLVSPEQWSPQFSKSFSQPVLSRFDDLRDLLLLDPVHDVGEPGWPVKVGDGN